MRRVGLAVLAASAVACGAPDSARDEFRAEVVPVLEARCASAACHGVAPGAEARGETIDWAQLHYRLDSAGRLADEDAAYLTTRRAIDTTDPDASSLLRKPLGVEAGGVAHLGGKSFFGRSDTGYRAIRGWIARETAGGEDPAPLGERERLFADEVQPVLVAGTCLTSTCHGPAAGSIPYRLDVGIDGRFPVSATRHNYELTLRMVTLDGYPRRSRLVRKAQPVGEGIVHKGLNFDFFHGEPGGGVDTLTRWICAEREARVGAGCAAPGAAPITGFVYVRGPVAPAHPYDVTTFAPGSDVWLATVTSGSLAPDRLENLTAALHPGVPADVRDPAVSRDGRQVAFALRASAEEGHHLWLLDLATRQARQLTSGNVRLPGGALATDRDPSFGPDGSVWFVSTRAGVVSESGGLVDTDVYSFDPATGHVRRWTHTPHVERRPTFYDLGDEAGGEVAFSALRATVPGRARAHGFRFPPSLETEYHQHFGITPVETMVHDLRELPDGRYAGIAGELETRWELGSVAIVDRNLGPEINARAASSIPALERYVPPMVVLQPRGGWRDPAPLADGRILVAHQPAPLDAGDPDAPFATRLEVLALEERADGGGPTLGTTTVLVEEPGVALTDPEPIARRAPVFVEDAALPEEELRPALVRHQGMPLIDALLSNLAPSGVKRPLEGIAWVRLVEHVPATPEVRAPLAVAGEPGATTTSLGGHGAARILAELPVAADGSFHAELPPGVPFRAVALDAARMTIGAVHDRWFDVAPGQVLTQGIATADELGLYGTRCASCHGDARGSSLPPAHAAPDVVSGASLSLARFERQNPRRPLAPTVTGDATRITVDFRRDVQPLLDRACVECHRGPDAAGGVTLDGAPTEHYSVAYERLLARGDRSGSGRQWIDDAEGRARRSHLIELLAGRELEAPGTLARAGTPHPTEHGGHAALSDEELLILVRWIELGAAFRGSTP
ncbi:MAG: hypothetical protein IT376_00565 [Polyangiaceae bacterium]|nr:hypothetical protein [Polyangiaceae bacterium]